VRKFFGFLQVNTQEGILSTYVCATMSWSLFDKLWLGVGCYQTWKIWASKGGLFFFKKGFFLRTANGWIVAKCLWARKQDSWNFWWARTKHTYKILDPLLLDTLLTIKPTFYYSYQPCVLSTLVCKTIYPHFIEVCKKKISLLTSNLINLNYLL
jgi:hypothetical protein